MHIVGAVEIIASLAVPVTPRFGGLLVAGWLAGIIASAREHAQRSGFTVALALSVAPSSSEASSRGPAPRGGQAVTSMGGRSRDP